MNHLSFNRRFLVGIIVLVQIAFVAVFAYSTTLLSSHDFRVFSYLPPVESIYKLSNVLWIGSLREASHLIAGVTNLLMGVLTILFSIRRRTEIIKFIAMTFGIQLCLSSLINFMLAGVILFGSWWHVFSAAFISLMAASSVVSLIILVSYRKHIRALGAWQDEIANDEQTKLIENMIEYEKENDSKVFK